MVANAEQLKHKLAALNERDGLLFKIKNNPRVTAAGRILRKFSLDDLPPNANEFTRFLRWLELAREALADALDAAGEAAPTAALEAIDRQDRALAVELGAAPAADAALGRRPSSVLAG